MIYSEFPNKVRALFKLDCRCRNFLAQVLVFSSLVISFVSESKTFSAEEFLSCAWNGDTEGRIECWGRHVYGASSDKAPGFSRLLDLQSGLHFSCALYVNLEGKTQIDCWGSDRTGVSADDRALVPGYEPIKMSVGSMHVCGIYFAAGKKNKVHCWGNDVAGEGKDQIQADGANFVYAGDGYTCTIRGEDGGYVQNCTGLKQYRGRWTLSSNPDDEYGFNPDGDELTCYASSLSPSESRQPQCFTNLQLLGHTKVDRISHSFYTQKHQRHCQIRDAQVSCRKLGAVFTDNMDSWDKYPQLDGARDISLGSFHLCAETFQGIVCAPYDDDAIKNHRHGQWEYKSASSDNVFVTGPYFADVSDLPYFLNRLSTYVYKEDKEFILCLKSLSLGYPRFEHCENQVVEMLSEPNEESQSQVLSRVSALKLVHLLGSYLSRFDYRSLNNTSFSRSLDNMSLLVRRDLSVFNPDVFTLQNEDFTWSIPFLLALLNSSRSRLEQEARTDIGNLVKIIAQEYLQKIEICQKSSTPDLIFSSPEVQSDVRSRLEKIATQHFDFHPYLRMRSQALQVFTRAIAKEN